MSTIPGAPYTPRTRRADASEVSSFSVVSIRATSLEICESVYGESTVSMDAIDHFYEPNAVYENPFITATSRSIIADIHQLSRQLSSIDVPRPLAMLCTLLRLKMPEQLSNPDPLFHGVRVWTDIGDICESESFDGHRKAMIEQTMNILFLPGIHCDYYRIPGATSSDSLVSVLGSPAPPQHHILSPSLRIPGMALCLPSPFHIQLHIVTRLSFNEQGRITHHRDFWDIRDVAGLMPGVSLAQWIFTRLTALGLSYISNLWTFGKTLSLDIHAGSLSERRDLERGATAAPVKAPYTSTTNTLGLDGV